jgi:hypothetical protein
MYKLFLAFLIIACASLAYADKATLTTPMDLGQTTVIDVSAVVFVYAWDEVAEEFVLSEVRISAIEGDVIGGQFVQRPGGDGYAVPAANVPAAIKNAAATLKTKAVGHYVAKKGYVVNP